MRYTEYHDGVAVIKDKSLMKEAIAKLAKYEDVEEESKESEAEIISRNDMIKRLYSYCDNRQSCKECIFLYDLCGFSVMKYAELKEAYRKLSESVIEIKIN